MLQNLSDHLDDSDSIQFRVEVTDLAHQTGTALNRETVQRGCGV